MNKQVFADQPAARSESQSYWFLLAVKCLFALTVSQHLVFNPGVPYRSDSRNIDSWGALVSL